MEIPIAKCIHSDDSIIGLSRHLKTNSNNPCITYDMSNVRFLQTGQVCLLAMFGKWCHNKGIKGSIAGLDKDSNVYKYLQRINFFNYLNIDTPEEFLRHEAKGFAEIQEIDNDGDAVANEIPERFREIICNTTRLSLSALSAFDKAFGEIMDNVLTHSRTELHGIASAQCYPEKGFIEFCITDVGIGIPGSLRKNPRYESYSDSELLKQAFVYGIGENVSEPGLSDEFSGCGYGLAFASKLAAVSGGCLWAISYDSAIRIDGKGTEEIDGCWFPGTVLCMRIPNDVTLLESDLDLDGKARPNRPFYWDMHGNDLEDIFEDDVLW